MKLPAAASSWVLACFWSANSPLAATTYSLVDLGAGTAMDINQSGKVVGNAGSTGWYYNGVESTGVTFNGLYPGMPPEAAFKNLLAFSANAINDAGHITGHYNFPGPTPTPYQYDGISLGTLYSVGTAGLGISPTGIIVGFGFRAEGNTTTPLPGIGSIGYAINAAGVAVGSTSVDSIDKAAVFQNDVTILDLQGVPLPPPPRGGSFSSRASSINTGSQIVGNIQLVSGSPFRTSWAFLHAQGAATPLKGLGGFETTANDINDLGIIVGSATTAEGATHAVIFEGTTAVDLNTRITSGGDGWVLDSAKALNNAGEIVGQGLKNGQARAFLLKPSSNELPPQITAHPQGITLFAGKPFQLSVTPSGTGPFTYQWKHAGTNLPAATGQTFEVASATPDHDGAYRVVVSNAFGSKESNEAIVVVRVAAQLSIARYAGLWLEGPEGRTYLIQATEHADDTHWQTLATLPLPHSPYFWLDTTSADHPNRIYRAQSVAP